MQKVLITGTDGFVGSVLRKAFKAAGFKVFGTVFMREAEADEVRLDITRDGALKSLPQHAFDVVIHTVGIVDQTAPKALMYAVNAEGTRKLLAWCKQVGCGHFIQISSIGVYGMRAMGKNRCEATTPTVGFLGVPYQKSKALAESYVAASGLPFTIVRLPAVIGAGDTFFSPTVKTALRDGHYFFFGKKNLLVSVLYVENLPSMLFKMIAKGPSNDSFNASCHDVSWRELVAEYARCMNINIDQRSLSWEYALPRFNDKSLMMLLSCAFFGAHFPNDKLRKSYGWKPEYSWQEGVRKAVQGLPA
jgi:nucleoside-diphosphate-sugar epimerase